MPKRRCAYCNDYFERDEMIISGLSSFCCREHLHLNTNSTKRRQAKTRSAKKIEAEVTAEVREMVLELDGFRCRYCGRTTGNLVAHHIAYRSEASNEPWLNEPVNLITLCNIPCHLDIIHGNKTLYQPLCRQIVYLRSLKADKVTTIEMLERELDEEDPHTPQA